MLNPENVGVAVEISFLCAIEAELRLYYAVFAWSDIYYLFAAAILEFWVELEWKQICHFVAQPYLEELTKSFPLTSSGSEMAAKRSS